MSARYVQILVACLVLMVADDGMAQSPMLAALPEQQCAYDENELVYPEKGADENKGCLLHFQQLPDDDHDGMEYESVADVMLNGKLTPVYRVWYSTLPPVKPNREYPSEGEVRAYAFSTADKLFSIHLTATVVKSSCRFDAGSCCGDTYRGVLSVEGPAGRETHRIGYYRGG